MHEYYSYSYLLILKKRIYSYSYSVKILIPNNIRIRIRSEKQYSLTSDHVQTISFEFFMENQMSSFVAVFRRFIVWALDLVIRSSNAHFVKLLTAETIWLVDQIQYVHTHRSSSSAASSAGQICLFYHQRDSWERNGEIWEQICFFWCRGEPIIVEQIQARTTFAAADGFRIWDLKLVRHKHCLKDLRLCTNTTQWRFKRHH